MPYLIFKITLVLVNHFASGPRFNSLVCSNSEFTGKKNALALSVKFGFLFFSEIQCFISYLLSSFICSPKKLGRRRNQQLSTKEQQQWGRCMLPPEDSPEPPHITASWELPALGVEVNTGGEGQETTWAPSQPSPHLQRSPSATFPSKFIIPYCKCHLLHS